MTSKFIKLFSGSIAVFACLFFTTSIVQAQDKEPIWQRIVTGDGYVLDVDASSLSFEPNRVLSARFRTSLKKPEAVLGTTGEKYKTRIETIQFRLNDYAYRVYETNLSDSKGKLLYSNTADSAKAWTVTASATARRLLSTARNLPPLGYWVITSYRYVDADAKKGSDVPELDQLVGSDIYLDIERITVRKNTCNSPTYESKTLTDKAFFDLLGTKPVSIGINSGSVNVIELKCETKEGEPPQSFLIRLPNGSMLMLWEGVFLELAEKKTKQFSLPIIIR